MYYSEDQPRLLRFVTNKGRCRTHLERELCLILSLSLLALLLFLYGRGKAKEYYLSISSYLLSYNGGILIILLGFGFFPLGLFGSHKSPRRKKEAQAPPLQATYSQAEMISEAKTNYLGGLYIPELT